MVIVAEVTVQDVTVEEPGYGDNCPLKDADGKINGAIQSIRDITERRQAGCEE